MKALICAVALVCLSLGQASARINLLDHAAPAADLNGDQLRAAASQQPERSHLRAVKSLVNSLYQAKDKETTELDGGKTVAQMIGLNEVSLADCTDAALQERADILRELNRNRQRATVAQLYLYATSVQAFKFCLVNGDQVVAQGLNSRQTMDGYYDLVQTAVDRHEWLEDLELKL